ncbi:DUF4123 domain-containing protein [Jannaschia pohangensis]|uniref:DUF4123 domain-containing protein n=1 Tax=Jannaschia pohangensis TaxID=390807 RepID=UPI000B81C714|nr:DUF4123 domain-containing protein [Jannaschia pohangensis]
MRPVSIRAVTPLTDASEPGSVPDVVASALDRFDLTSQLYAVIDASRFPNLVERLAGSSAFHQCLFRGVWAEEYGDVAPWLVKVTPSDEIFSALMTRSALPWHNFDRFSALLILSSATPET